MTHVPAAVGEVMQHPERRLREGACREPRGATEGAGLYERIYALVRRIPAGKVASYGQIAAAVGGCTPRMVGYAMAATPVWMDVPWQRVINSRGEVSPRAHGAGDLEQRQRLEEEGVVFDPRGRIDLARFGWRGEGRRRGGGRGRGRDQGAEQR